jgi:hypothetical protein
MSQYRSDRLPPLEERRTAPPWLRAMIAIAIIFALGTLSLASGASNGQNGQAGGQQGLPTATFGAFIQSATRIPTPTRIRIPTRMPDTGTNRNGDMCTTIASEHAARPDVPLCTP